MRKITYREALNEALREELKRDDRVFLLGEDIGRDWEGAFKVTKDLAAEFGDERVRDTPISENAIAGVAVGAAMTGMRPVAEIMFGDLIALAMDQIVNQAGKIHYMFGGQASVPITIPVSVVIINNTTIVTVNTCLSLLFTIFFIDFFPPNKKFLSLQSLISI